MTCNRTHTIVVPYLQLPPHCPGKAKLFLSWGGKCAVLSTYSISTLFREHNSSGVWGPCFSSFPVPMGSPGMPSQLIFDILWVAEETGMGRIPLPQEWNESKNWTGKIGLLEQVLGHGVKRPAYMSVPSADLVKLVSIHEHNSCRLCCSGSVSKDFFSVVVAKLAWGEGHFRCLFKRTFNSKLNENILFFL